MNRLPQNKRLSELRWPADLFPLPISAPNITGLGCQTRLHPNDPSLFQFLDRFGKEVLFVRQRIIQQNSKKACLPWSFWSDGEWRQMEPDGALPLYGLNELSKLTLDT